MDLGEVQAVLSAVSGTLLSEAAVGQWQLDGEGWRLLVLTDPERDWLRAMIPVMPEDAALSLATQLLEANFDRTREARFAIQEGVLWVVYQHRLSTVAPVDLRQAIDQLLALRQTGFSNAFEQFADTRLGQIVSTLKQQGQSLEEALQLLGRLYEEGVLGDLQDSRAARETTLEAWRGKLTRLWQNPTSQFN